MISEEKFLALAKAKYAQINGLESSASLLDYERGLWELMRELSRQVMEEQLGDDSKDRRKKKAIDGCSSHLSPS